MKLTKTTVAVLAALTALSMGSGAELRAQTVSQEQSIRTLREMVAEPAPGAENRRVIREFLEHDQVREAARSNGMDPERLEARAETLDAEAANDLASRIEKLQDEGVLAGGDTLVISASTVIIVLLILILVAVA